MQFFVCCIVCIPSSRVRLGISSAPAVNMVPVVLKRRRMAHLLPPAVDCGTPESVLDHVRNVTPLLPHAFVGLGPMMMLSPEFDAIFRSL